MVNRVRIVAVVFLHLYDLDLILTDISQIKMHSETESVDIVLTIQEI